ncbi:DUF397 domain-containing protein [Nocardia sp. NPDC051570]|uniref:DUF397 domain-containing protein n=1 Tax=Nocardia sp. NPDC051570 TaxID=3364324 RepID=UPI0037B0F7FD
MDTSTTTGHGWFKSSFSTQSSSCVEALFTEGAVLIRDSKYLRNPANDPAAQPIISILAKDWREFLASATGVGVQSSHGVPVIEAASSGAVVLRAGDGTTLTYTPDEWTAFVSGIRAGEFARV